MLKGVIIIALISFSLQNFCSVNGAKGECTLIGECKGTQIVSQCPIEGYGCCLTGANSLMEEYKDFSFWGWLRRGWERFKENPWKYIKIIVDIILNREISFKYEFSRMSTMEKSLYENVKQVIKGEKNPIELVKKMEPLIKTIDREKLAPDFISGKFIANEEGN